MRVFILVIFISAYIISPKNASAQYKSFFGDSTTSWSIVIGDCIDDFSSLNFHYSKDTLIHDTAYKILSLGRYWNVFLREDTTTGKLWFRENVLAKENLIADMSLQEGDSFHYYNPEQEEFFLLPVDTIYYQNGNKIIQFETSIGCHYKQKFYFIEGTGPSNGFYYSGDNEVMDGYLLCHYKDNKRVFTSIRFKDYCSIDSWIGIKRDFKTEKNINVYPNPTSSSGIISFQNDKNACLNLEIYDLNGKRIFTNSSQTTYVTFDINAFENGIYVYKLMNEKGEFSSGRILKQ